MPIKTANLGSTRIGQRTYPETPRILVPNWGSINQTKVGLGKEKQYFRIIAIPPGLPAFLTEKRPVLTPIF